jgi:hypothetical protein
MSSSSITVKTKADANVVLTLAGQTANGALYLDATRQLAVPKTLSFNYQVGAPGSRGNDKLSVTLKDSAANAITGEVKTLQAKLEISVPRDAAITRTMVDEIICHFQALSVDAYAEAIAGALVP